MKILRHGYKIRPLVFECNSCGCKYEALDTEYWMTLNPITSFHCYCPECKVIVTLDNETVQKQRQVQIENH